MHGIMFHHSQADKKYIQTQGSISADDLRRLIDFYRDKGYTIIDVVDYFEKQINGK